MFGKYTKRMLAITIILLIYVQNSVGQPNPTDPPYSTSDWGAVRRPVAPQRISSNIKLPVNTHNWFVNLYYNGTDWSDQEYPQMISLIADPFCIHVNKQGRSEPLLTNMEIRYVYNYGAGNPHSRIPHELTDAIAVYTKSGSATNPQLDDYSDWGMKMIWNGGQLEAWASNGCPFVYFQSNDGGITVKTDDSARVWFNENGVIGVEVAINHFDNATQTWFKPYPYINNYVIFGPTGCEWDIDSTPNGRYTFTSDLKGKNYTSIATIPNDSDDTKKIENVKYFKRFAYNFIKDTKVSWEYDEAKSVLRTTFTGTLDKKEETSDGALYALYPHQWLNYKGAIKDIEYNSAKGPMKVVETNGTFVIEQPYFGILPHFPLVAGSASGYSEATLKDMVTELVAAGEATNIFQGNEVYATAVTIGRTAQVIHIADQLGMTAERDEVIRWVKNAVGGWFSYPGNGGFFVYDSNYGALIGNPPNHGMFTDLHLNDAHFQLGYMLKAAAIVAMFDREWMKTWDKSIQTFIKYVANWKRNESKFPFLRFMDPYHGHSWATGDADFRDGNNQESSSECLNCYSAIALWGMVTGNKEIRDLGIYLYTTESDAVMNYWWDYLGITYPNGPDHGAQENAIWEPALYHYPASGWMWGDKVGFATWFGSEQTGYQEYPIGINLLPMTASSVYLARNADYINNGLIGWFIKKYGKVNRWNELFWTCWALTDPQSALDKFKTNPKGASEPSPPSETDPHYYHWMHNMHALGPYNPTIKADVPSFGVFGKYYVAYNPTGSEISPKFSDGTTFKVPPYQIGAFQQANDVKPANNNAIKKAGSIIIKWNNKNLVISAHVQANSTLILYNLKGKKLETVQVNKGKTTHILKNVSFSAGTYILTITSNLNQIESRSILIE